MSKLQDMADRRGISERALVMDAIDGAPTKKHAADKLTISRQALDDAMERLGIIAVRVVRLRPVLKETLP